MKERRDCTTSHTPTQQKWCDDIDMKMKNMKNQWPKSSWYEKLKTNPRFCSRHEGGQTRWSKKNLSDAKKEKMKKFSRQFSRRIFFISQNKHTHRENSTNFHPISRNGSRCVHAPDGYGCHIRNVSTGKTKTKSHFPTVRIVHAREIHVEQ